MREDSSEDPIAYGEEKILPWYQHHKVDAKGKLFFPSNVLTFPKVIAIYKYFVGRITTSSSIGTNATNDFVPMLDPVSMVVKATNAGGHPTVKLSDHLAKASGPAEEIERYKCAAGYTNATSVACTY